MAKITNEIVEASYRIARRINKGRITQKRGVDILESKYGMNRKSAGDYILCYDCMVTGKRFTRTTNAYGTEYYLQQILNDKGQSGLANALSSLRQHIDYYEEVGNASVRTRQAIYDEFAKLLGGGRTNTIFPDEVKGEDATLLEGKVRRIKVNIYERKPKARRECIEHHGAFCQICGFDFELTWGDAGKGFIHVHHLVELSSIGKEYRVDPINDLIPVCPNCHAMFHRRRPAFTIDEMKKALTSGELVA
jgi:5-methylcytosine-specific restriction protein A